MANKTSFTPDEWTKIMESVMLSGMAVTAADPSGLIGVLKESMATGRSLLDAKASPEANELIRAVATDFTTSEGRQAVREGLKAKLLGGGAGDVGKRSISALREVSSLLDSKAPDDAPGFKTWLQQIATGTAEAASEGGFLGFGGVRVSEAEKAAIGELANALGVASASKTAGGQSSTATATTPTPGEPSGPTQGGKA
jgi:hypothetical protein